MPAPVAGIHVFVAATQSSKAWMAGTSPAMTEVSVYQPRLASASRPKIAKTIGLRSRL
jgi:hypothetical protein